MADPSNVSADCDVQGDDKASIIAHTDGTSESETAALATQRWPGLATSTRYPGQDVASILARQRSIS